MKILNSEQIREADQYTIANEPIESIDLMERASKAFLAKFSGIHPERKQTFIFCGTGNNGGDGLAVGRMLIEKGWKVEIFIAGNPDKGSDDFKINLKRLKEYKSITSEDHFPLIPSDSIIIDGLFGSGLSRPIEGLNGKLIEYLNDQEAQRIAIDISSGLFSDQPLIKNAIAFKADYTISFQVPKLAFFQPDSADYVGEWRIVDIGLNKSFIQNQKTDYHLTEPHIIRNMIPVRSRFTHKTQVGKLMIVAGSKGKMGAAVLAARASFKSGVGLVNVHTPSCGTDILQISVPEAMVSLDPGLDFIESIPKTDNVIAIGPGLGQNQQTKDALKFFLKSYNQPLVLDADVINILSTEKEILEMLPRESILTPHPGEFKRLVGEWKDDFEKLEKLKSLCSGHKLNVVLKGAQSAVCSSEGQVYFNPTGNQALATAGSGDVLTGMIGSFLAQGLAPLEALRLGVYLHGAAGDEAVGEIQTPWLQASDIITFIPKALYSLLNF